MKREIFENSIAYSKTIKDLKIPFDWEIGPISAIEKLLTENTSIRKLHLVIENYDNDLRLITFIRRNKGVKDFVLDLYYHDTNSKRNPNGYHPPIDLATGQYIPSISRIETLQLYHGVKTNKSYNDFLASFPP